MTDNNNETTEVLPTAEMPAVEQVAAAPGVVVAAPAVEYKTPETKPVTGTSKALIIVAAVVLGFVVLGTTFASGVMVGTHVGGRGGVVAAQRSQLGAPGVGQLGGQQGGGFDQGGGRGRGRGGRGGFGGQTDPQGQTVPQNQTAPDGSTGQPQ